MLLFTLLQTACSKETNSEDNCNAVGSCWSTVSKQQWQKTAYALAFNMFSQSVSRFLVLGHRYQDFLFWVTGINISCFGSHSADLQLASMHSFMEGLVSQSSQHSRSPCKGQASTTCWEDLQADSETGIRAGEKDAGCTFGHAGVLKVSMQLDLD